jgi:hypothetical protein
VPTVPIRPLIEGGASLPTQVWKLDRLGRDLRHMVKKNCLPESADSILGIQSRLSLTRHMRCKLFASCYLVSSAGKLRQLD